MMFDAVALRMGFAEETGGPFGAPLLSAPRNGFGPPGKLCCNTRPVWRVDCTH